MDLLIEILGEILIEGSLYLATNKKISKWIRYPLLVLLIIFYAVIILGILYLGIKIFRENLILSIFMIASSIFLLIVTIIAFYKKVNC